MKNFNYPSNLKEHIEKKDVSAYFYDKEDMEKALAYNGHMCGSRGYFLYRKDGYRGAICAFVSCPYCPFNVENKALLKSMLPQLNEASSQAEETPETQIKKIEDYLKQGNTLTKLDALKMFGIWNSGDVIYKLRKRGLNIKTEMVTRNGKTFAEYSLENTN